MCKDTKKKELESLRSKEREKRMNWKRKDGVFSMLTHVHAFSGHITIATTT